MKKTRLTALLLTLALLLGLSLSGFAAPAETANESAAASEPAQTEPVQAEAPQSTATEPDAPAPLKEYGLPVDYEVEATAAALIELNSDTLAYGYNIDKRIYPASLTKIMTCMVAIKNGHMNDLVTVTESSLADFDPNGSSAGLKIGEQLTLRELLYCIMVESANDACDVVAEYIAGDIDTYVQMMNDQAKALGMTSTHYVNTHGMHDSEHYTTVRDLSTLSRWAWQYEEFQEFATTTMHTVPATNLSDERKIYTTNYLVSTHIQSQYYYSKASGIKTGFTTPAGCCLISTAKDKGLYFMSIVCGCEMRKDSNGADYDMRFPVSKKLFEYGFDHFSFVQVLTDTKMQDQPSVLYAAGRGDVVVHAAQKVSVLLPDSCKRSDIRMELHYDTEQLEAPLTQGQRVGTVSAVYDGHTLATCDLVTLTAVSRSSPIAVAEKSDNFFARMVAKLLRYWYLSVPVTLLFFLVCALLIVRWHNIRKAKRRHGRRRARR